MPAGAGTPSADVVEAAVAQRLSEDGAAHSRAVAETARLLAVVYGVDTFDAWLAGMLHDWDRELDDDAVEAHARGVGLELGDEDLRAPKLLHARTAASALAEEFPGLGAEVLRAVEVHTLGDTDMSSLDMVVYVADMISADRDFPGVDDLREAAGTVSLPDLFALCYQRTVMHVVETCMPLHPTTTAVWNAYVARGPR